MVYDSQHHYSGLEVVPGTSPQVVADPTLPEAITGPVKSPATEKIAYFQAPDAPDTPARTQRICGLSRKLFYSLLAGAVILVIGAIAGGVGGALSQRNKASTQKSASDNSAANETAQGGMTTQSVTTATATTAATEATAVVGPSSTLWRDCPGANDTVYTPSRTDQQYRKLCNNLYWGVKGNIINERTSSLNDCIDTCAAWNVEAEANITAGEKNPCSTVCWRNTFDSDYPGQCFGWTMKNATDGQFNVSTRASDVQCDSAAWINIWDGATVTGTPQ
ncbi:hypothetical protein BJ166DRAFT_299589 [Pestalotiopsis sp. NC0098]|nr:hypothetical protein BJ166DRAFT_299589 [Pestalotiopsis sp. NC0098]